MTFVSDVLQNTTIKITVNNNDIITSFFFEEKKAMQLVKDIFVILYRHQHVKIWNLIRHMQMHTRTSQETESLIDVLMRSSYIVCKA